MNCVEHFSLFQALVSVSQPESGRVWLDGPRTEKYGQTDTSLGLWAECDTLGDHVTVYDGPGGPHSQGASPALIRMCRGGRVPEVSMLRTLTKIKLGKNKVNIKVYVQFVFKCLHGFTF